jgi:hypothetical protein
VPYTVTTAHSHINQAGTCPVSTYYGLCPEYQLSFSVTANPAYVVLMIACGGGDSCSTITGLPSGCVGTPTAGPDGMESVALYTCNSVSPSSYTVTSYADHGGLANMAMASYVFYNITGVPTSYGTYDNGASVFPTYYTNFSTPASIASWTLTETPDEPSWGLVTANDGLSITGSLGAIGQSTAAYYGSGIADTDASFSAPYSSSVSEFLAEDQGTPIYLGYTGYSTSLGSCVGGTCSYFSPQPSAGYHIWSFIVSPTSLTTEYDYGTGSAITTPISSSSYGAPGFGTYDFSPTAYAYWLRIRSYPPNGVMPSVSSFGSVSSS